MKLRNGFVSNSSSSSFIVIEKGELDQIKHLYVEDGVLNIDGENGHYSFGWERLAANRIAARKQAKR